MNEEEKDKAYNDYMKKFNLVPFFVELTDVQIREEWFIKRLLGAVKIHDPEIYIEDHVKKGVDY